MMDCDRCTLLFNTLERVIRRNDDGFVTIDTRICESCAFQCGFLSVSPRSEELEEPEETFEAEVLQDEVPPLHIEMYPTEAPTEAEALESQTK